MLRTAKMRFLLTMVCQYFHQRFGFVESLSEAHALLPQLDTSLPPIPIPPSS
ncbi:MAG: hypothetical protein HC915_08540 [Anaerolineae bacterium]|nr:hypothetical protein [Anaerolineae bacterium]